MPQAAWAISHILAHPELDHLEHLEHLLEPMAGILGIVLASIVAILLVPLAIAMLASTILASTLVCGLGHVGMPRHLVAPWVDHLGQRCWRRDHVVRGLVDDRWCWSRRCWRDHVLLLVVLLLVLLGHQLGQKLVRRLVRRLGHKLVCPLVRHLGHRRLGCHLGHRCHRLGCHLGHWLLLVHRLGQPLECWNAHQLVAEVLGQEGQAHRSGVLWIAGDGAGGVHWSRALAKSYGLLYLTGWVVGWLLAGGSKLVAAGY